MTFKVTHIYKEGNCCVNHIVNISIRCLVSLGGITRGILLRMIFTTNSHLVYAIVNYDTLFSFIKILSYGGKVFLMSQSVFNTICLGIGLVPSNLIFFRVLTKERISYKL
jgi:hypothetical protein